ncbi:MAG: hypothetical protein JSR45_15350 [Proteobacteria bacterium]|nr:hypothetical protein [Pseudomonadota bacterium]
MNFPITNCALEGFQVIKRAPLAVVAWIVLYLVAIGLMFWGLFAAMGQAGLLTAFGADIPRDTTDPTAVFKAMGPMLGVFGLMFPASIVLSMVMLCAIMRAVLRPEDKGFFYLRLGGDELRVFVVALVYYILAIVLFGALIGGIVLGCIAEWQANKGLSILIGFAGGCAVFAIAVVFWNKLCLSFPATFATRSIRLFDGWALSRGRFWPLVGMNLLALLIGMAISIGFSMVAQIFQASAMGSMVRSAGGGSPFVLNGPVLISFALAMAVNMIGAVVQMVVVYSPAAAAYREIVRPNQAAEF